MMGERGEGGREMGVREIPSSHDKGEQSDRSLK